MSIAKNLDQFYTNPIIASRFVNKVKSLYSLDDFDNVIEPSAGTGVIYDLLPEHNRYGVDIDPKREDLIKDDFFDHSFPTGNNIVIGNPPFGRKGSMAIDFFNRCAKFSDTIAFILPKGFARVLTHKNLNPEFGLYWSCILPENAFIHNDRPYSVKCVAQIWSRAQPSFGDGGYESWNPEVSDEIINNLDEYYFKNKSYEKPKTLF